MPTDKIAQEICDQWNREDSKSSQTMTLYQQVADHFLQRENSITSKKSEGEDKSLPILDPTGMLDLQDMVAGLCAAIIPNGQNFFRLLARDSQLNDIPRVASYLNRLTERVHIEMFRANFILEFCEYLTSLVSFGTGNIYSGWDSEKVGLFYKDWDVANYRFGVDKRGLASWCLVKWAYTAEQAYAEFKEQAGEKVIKYANDPAKSQEKFNFIWRVQKRKNRNPELKDNKNWEFEEICVNETEKVVVSESGYRRFPYHIARWLLSSQEIWGRGQGTIALSADKELQSQRKALLTCANRANFPPMQTHQSFEGTPKTYPGANNVVTEMDNIKALDLGVQGNFPITKDTILMQQEILHRCFFVKVFAPLDALTGDRRTQMEIYERVKAGYIRLILPITRIYNEGLTGCIEDSTMHIIENHLMEPPPPELRAVKIDYLGRLALALQEQQSDAFQRFAQFAIGMEQVIPGFTKKTINVNRAGRRMATTFGMNEGDLNTEEERAAIEAEEMQMKQQQQTMMAAQAAGTAYKDTSTAPEKGSPAEQVMAGMEQGV